MIAKVEKAERRPSADLVGRLDQCLGADGDLVRLATATTQERRVEGAAGPVDDIQPPRLPGEELADALLKVLAGLRRLDHGLGSGHALAALLAHAELARAMLDGLGGEGRRDLFLTLAQVHQLAGWIQFDSGDLKTGQHEFSLARNYAELGSSDALVAFILGPSHGFALTYSGRPRSGVPHIDEALIRARRSGNRRLTGFVLTVKARAQAKLGNTRRCLELLDEAEVQLSRHAPTAPDPAWLEVFDDAALAGHRGSCWLDLGEAARAVEPLASQDMRAPRLFVRNRASWLLDRAKAHAQLNQVDAACAVVESALDVLSGTSSERTIARLRGLTSSLGRWSQVPEVRHLQERVRAELAA